jgi:ankyrin repeat protein
MAGVSYSTLRDYVTNHCRRPATSTPPADATTPAHQAVGQQDLALLRDLLDAGHDIEDDNGNGWTLFRHAIAVEHDGHRQTAEYAHADMTVLLLARGADPQRLSPDGTTPLDDAETQDHWLAVEIIRAWTAPPPAPRSPTDLPSTTTSIRRP